MSKVKKEIVGAAVVKLLANITSTMPSLAYKFLMGGATAVATMNNGQKISEMFGAISDTEGYVDVDLLKTAIQGGFDASGGKVTIDLFKDQTGILGLIVKPVIVTITREDISQLIAEIEANSIQTVSLSASTQLSS